MRSRIPAQGLGARAENWLYGGRGFHRRPCTVGPMPTVNTYPQGAPCWADVQTPDVDSPKTFYAAVFGWAVDPELGAGMIRLPGYGDHLAATVDPHIHER